MNTQIRRQTLGDLLRRTARRFPNKIGLVYGAEEWTYSEFDAICNQLAHGLAERGVSKGDRVSILAYNSNAFAALRFAIARLGAVLVPVNFMLNAKEAAYNVGHSGASVLCVGSDFIDKGLAIKEMDNEVETMVWLPGLVDEPTPDGWITYNDLFAENTDAPKVDLDGTDLAQIIYTSGTESLPKGALLSHEAIIWQYVSVIVDGEITTSDNILHTLPLYHCAQLDCFLGPGIYVGSTNVILATPTPEAILPLIESHKINSFFSPPTVWIALMRSPLFEKYKVSYLNKGYYGAAIMPVEVLKELSQRLPQIRLWNFYGQTEIAPLATVLGPDDQMTKLGSAGLPTLNVETRVVDDSMVDIQPGEIGEIVHRSPQLLLGYFKDEERTKAAFEGGWFHSGDLATIDEDGYISVVDRKKDMIKTGGENVASREVEEAIYLLPEVEEVAVIGIAHPYWIEAVVAVIVVKDAETLTEEAVIKHCRKELAHFKAPKQVVFADSLPKNPSGKVLKRDLRTSYADIVDKNAQ